jgi:hypothetical protein
MAVVNKAEFRIKNKRAKAGNQIFTAFWRI